MQAQKTRINVFFESISQDVKLRVEPMLTVSSTTLSLSNVSSTAWQHVAWAAWGFDCDRQYIRRGSHHDRAIMHWRISISENTSKWIQNQSWTSISVFPMCRIWSDGWKLSYIILDNRDLIWLASSDCNHNGLRCLVLWSLCFSVIIRVGASIAPHVQRIFLENV